MPSALAVQKVNSAVHLVSQYLMDKGVDFSTTYTLVGVSSGG